jgi:hypothetical protein
VSASWRDHRVLIHHGQYDTHKDSTCPYETMALGEVFDMEPRKTPKLDALAMIPSSYCESDGRTHAVQQDRGQFVAICGDIDKGNKRLYEVAEMVEAFTGDEVASRVYSTSSATTAERKWRIVIPLEMPLSYKDWHAAIKAFFAFAESRGFKMDDALSRAGQPVYLPNVPPEKRGVDGEPLFFQNRLGRGERGLRLTDPGLANSLVTRDAARAPALQARSSSGLVHLSAALISATRPTPIGPVERYNAENPIEGLLEKYGYVRKANDSPDWRSPLQTSDSYATAVMTGDDGKPYWVSLSSSDKAARLGRESGKGTRYGEAFDLFVHFEHGGNRTAALTALTAPETESIVAAASAGDPGAALEGEAVATLRCVRDSDRAEWARVRQRLKEAGTPMGQLDDAMEGGADSAPDDERSVADRLIELARHRCRFLRDATEYYAVIQTKTAREIHRIDSSAFRDFLSHAYYTTHDRAPAEPSLRTALATLRGQAQHEGDRCDVHIRVAKTEAGYWLDLCNEGWECVLITATGWRVASGDAAPCFTRSSSMRALPMPERGGMLDALWPLVNVPEPDRLLVLAWMLECLRPDTPHVVLELVGEQGSAKSSTQRVLRRLIDPNEADLRAAPKSVEDVWVAARNAHLVSLENLSHLPPPYQDALCVLATGGGYSARTLYTNAEETILNLRKPIALNGIIPIVTAQDLLDRCLHIDLPTIQHRELAGELEKRFEVEQPRLLGALLDLFVEVLAMLPSVSIAPSERPRMADFAALGEAVYGVHGRPAGEFLERYAAMRQASVMTILDGSAVGAALRQLLEVTPDGYRGSLGQLLVLLEPHRPHAEAWPRSPKGLGDALRRLAPALRLVGIECKALPKSGGEIRWHIFPAPQTSQPCPASPESPGGTAFGAPEGGDAGHSGHSGHGLAVPQAGNTSREPTVSPPLNGPAALRAVGHEVRGAYSQGNYPTSGGGAALNRSALLYSPPT